jgi:hypothetical protein
MIVGYQFASQYSNRELVRYEKSIVNQKGVREEKPDMARRYQPS